MDKRSWKDISELMENKIIYERLATHLSLHRQIADERDA